MRSRGTNIWKSLFDGITSKALGRIHQMSNMWAIVDSAWDRNRVFNPNLVGSKHYPDGHLHGKQTDDGLLTILVKRRCTTGCPNPPSREFAKIDGTWNVPMSLCRQCQYHQPRKRGVSYPCCLFKRAKDPLKAAVEELDTITSKAVEQTERIMGGKL